jgi:PTH2 family peptidyl-tRNA hydrolase
MANIKQVIAIRTDLNMRKGKMCAQVAHAAMKVFFDKMTITNGKVFGPSGTYQERRWVATIESITPEMKEWMEGAFTKVVVGVDSEEAIYELAKRAEELNIPHAVIIDNGFTEFHGNKTTTCIAIGPDNSDKIDQITKELKLI